MPYLGMVEVSPEEADEAAVTASATGDPGDDDTPLEPLNNIWECLKAEYSSAEDRIDADVRRALARLVRKLHVRPNPNSRVRGMDMDDILDLF